MAVEKRKRKALEKQKQEALEQQRQVALEKKRRLRTMAVAAALVAPAVAVWVASRPPTTRAHADAGDADDAGVVAVPSVAPGQNLPQGLASHLAAQTSTLGADIFVNRTRDGQSTVVTSEDTIRAGDVLHVAVSQPTSGRVAAWFVGADGRVDRVVPPGIIVLPAGRATIPGKMTVASPCVDIDVVALIGAPHSLAEIEQRMKDGVDSGASQRGGDAWLPPGVLHRHLRCE